MLPKMKKTKPLLKAREIFGLNVRRARRLKEISQEELAFQADISRTYLSEVERGERNISVDNMESLSIALEITLPELLNPYLFTVGANEVQE